MNTHNKRPLALMQTHNQVPLHTNRATLCQLLQCVFCASLIHRSDLAQAWFETGIRSLAVNWNDWHAQWIERPRRVPLNASDDCSLFEQDPSPLFRRDYTLLQPPANVARARLCVTSPRTIARRGLNAAVSCCGLT